MPGAFKRSHATITRMKRKQQFLKAVQMRRTPTFRPLGAEVKKDFPSLLALVFVCAVSVCASKNFREERTSRDRHCPSSLPVFCRVRVFTAARGLTSSFFDPLVRWCCAARLIRPSGCVLSPEVALLPK